MKHELILEQIKRVLAMQERNMTVSPYTSGRKPVDFVGELLGEAEELSYELHTEKFSEHDLTDELGDVIGSFALLVLGLSDHIENACDLQVEKYRRRKPHIFPDFTGEFPSSSAEEVQIWAEAKRKEKEAK